MAMKIEREDLDWAINDDLIDADIAEQLWQGWQERKRHIPQFNFANVAYYFGALVVIFGMFFCLTSAWEKLGGQGILTLACVYLLIFALAGFRMWFARGLKIPGGLLTTIAVFMVPLAIYGFQRMTGIWPNGDPGSYENYHIWVKASWFYMEMGTILAGLFALWWIRFAFLTLPIAYSLWYMSMDLTPLLFGKDYFTWNERCLVSFWFGIANIIIAFLIDRRIRRSQGDFAFWLYLSGMMAFWGGLTFMNSGGEWERFLYFLINLFLIILSILLRRRIFVIFGAMGTIGYLGHLSYSVFRDSLLFPIATSFVGVLIILAGMQYQKNSNSIAVFLNRVLPESLLQLLPKDN
ncbi:putative membrane protein (DUF2157) [Synechococcus sp. PCC 7502]|uniref:DUF2157 domain-containing protein n=1 Tax=Synechococcus sp. PCC 7502 TaxID=1173263 RepID=UPI00029FACAA|nr:DUF2157 domain-containing protein [Synechococcus sp. PCC 7502]AFY73509.1 putative membrane protein (DUF2157) [Synechococcus sp. PCC 7502]